MPRTQYYTAVSLDGYIADPDNSLDWLFTAGSSATKEDRFRAFFSRVGAMTMGATTYQWVLEHDQLLHDPRKWRAYYGATPCWVFTHRALPEVPGANLRFVHGDVRDVHRQMAEAAGGKNVWLVGGGDLASQFADRGLLDDLLLSVAPVVLGGGAPVLPRRLPGPALTLRAVEDDGSFVFLSYQVAGSRQTAPPSATSRTR
jgi:dihydrofolate reductase